MSYKETQTGEDSAFPYCEVQWSRCRTTTWTVARGEFLGGRRCGRDWSGLTPRACKAWHFTQTTGRTQSGGWGGTHQGLRVLFLGAMDTGEDVLVLTLRHFLCTSGSLALGRRLAIQFKFRHISGVSTTAGATLGWQNTRESKGNEENNHTCKWKKNWGETASCLGNHSWPKIPASALSRGLSDWMTFIICLFLVLLILLLLPLSFPLLLLLFLFSVARGRVEGLQGGKRGCRQAGREIGQGQYENTQQMKTWERQHREMTATKNRIVEKALEVLE